MTSPGVDESAGVHYVLPLKESPVITKSQFIQDFKEATTKQAKIEACVRMLSSYGMTGDPVFDEYR